MIVALFRRRLKDGAEFEDFIEAWEADKGFGVPARVFNAVSLDDPRGDPVDRLRRRRRFRPVGSGRRRRRPGGGASFADRQRHRVDHSPRLL